MPLKIDEINRLFSLLSVLNNTIFDSSSPRFGMGGRLRRPISYRLKIPRLAEDKTPNLSGAVISLHMIKVVAQTESIH